MRILLLLVVLSFPGCAISIDGQRYKNQPPEFKPEVFFNGKVKAWGIVQNRSGEVVQQFSVDINGTWEDGLLIMDEKFHYFMGDGIKQRQ